VKRDQAFRKFGAKPGESFCASAKAEAADESLEARLAGQGSEQRLDACEDHLFGVLTCGAFERHHRVINATTDCANERSVVWRKDLWPDGLSAIRCRQRARERRSGALPGMKHIAVDQHGSDHEVVRGREEF